ncbi:hypothetical protein RHSIM_Rhsim04G0150000 [Rhododendron simsii]|uniref:RNA helicase n=1 Tax=Rhododendron simsii TaxID=118357 RepID=A0A834LPI1_RHOSS|nr:hypothetical protein RHSIM_Rhsim04G0150000 [Rhododendron simsii]
MEKGTSFLFSGITFNRKKFSGDFERFKEKKESNDLLSNEATLIESQNNEMDEITMPGKKRKRKAMFSEPVEGFNVFKSSKSAALTEENNQTGDEIAQGKKEIFRKIERDALVRKKHNIHTSGSTVPSPLQDFAELKSRVSGRGVHGSAMVRSTLNPPPDLTSSENIRQEVLCALRTLGVAFHMVSEGRECFACAPTGSGKTLAFVCPMLMKLKHASKDGVRAVILCPTRELAAQTARECKKLAKGKKFYIKLMTKQLVKSADFSKLHCDILISTPFRLQFAICKRKLDLSRVEYLVLDESDKLFELDLVEQVDSVVKACSSPSILRSLYSATLPDSVEELARTIMHDAVRIIVGRKNAASESIKQNLIFVGSEEGKLLALRQSFAECWNPPVLVFVQNKERAKELYRELAFDNVRADVIHADLSQIQRENAVDNFRAGKTWVLIATDVIARGMDFKGVNCVINYDFPDSAAAYIHRIGRSGRAGRSGEAITLYTESDVPFLRNIANVMAASGCEVPAWIMSLPKKKWKKHRPQRDAILTKPKDEEE